MAKIDAIIGGIEVELDKFFDAGYVNTGFDPYKYYNFYQLKAPAFKAIVSHYEPLLIELADAVEKNDPQVVEAYSHLTKKKLNEYFKFVGKIITQAGVAADERKAKSAVEREQRKAQIIEKRRARVKNLKKKGR